MGGRIPGLAVSLMPTEHAGHATQLSRSAADSGRPLVVSVGGDGGYNEVVNGVMQAGNDQASTAVLAAGNANDHRRSTAEMPIAVGIAAARQDASTCSGSARTARPTTSSGTRTRTSGWV